MKKLHTVRLLLLALLISIVPAVSHAGVFISVGFAPPPLPVYVQPDCPDPGLMWTPGYWAYGQDGYYWVPGAWVPAPYDGALWTPGYWGWDAGFYVWHPGYWGQYVGYYGGVNYGFGYFGIGFVGGRWHGNYFEYNTAVMHLDRGRIHHFYDDRAVVSRYTVSRGSHVSYNGGRGGINYRPSAAEQRATHEQHSGPTSYQTQHETQFRNDRNAYSKVNHGRPQQAVERQPLRGESRPVPKNTMQRPQQNRNMQQQNRNTQQARPNYQMQRPANPSVQNRNAQQNQQRQQQNMQRQEQQNQQRQQQNMQREQQNQQRQQQREQQQHTPQSRNEARPQQESKPAPRNDRQKPKEPRKPEGERR
ncbi:MAG: YXWGXW repeat-containing protein [Terracidiphilus sp.]